MADAFRLIRSSTAPSQPTCLQSLDADAAPFLYRDLESEKLVVFREDCAAYADPERRQRFTLVAL